jgi:hypothetical protein
VSNSPSPSSLCPPCSKRVTKSPIPLSSTVSQFHPSFTCRNRVCSYTIHSGKRSCVLSRVSLYCSSMNGKRVKQAGRRAGIAVKTRSWTRPLRQVNSALTTAPFLTELSSH